jgi:hypothetical protein
MHPGEGAFSFKRNVNSFAKAAFSFGEKKLSASVALEAAKERWKVK